MGRQGDPRRGRQAAGARRKGTSVDLERSCACYLCFVGKGLKYFVPVGLAPLPPRAKRRTDPEDLRPR